MVSQAKIFFLSFISGSPAKRKAFVSSMVIPLLCISLACAETMVTPPPIPDGGPCESVSYKGLAEIASLRSIEQKEGLRVREVYEMKFRFIPKEEVDFFIEDLVESREFVEIFYKDGPPGKTLTGKDKDDLRVGTVLPCILLESIRGTCTPRMFVFPTLVEGFVLYPELDRPKDMRPMRATGTIIAYEAGKSITIKGTSEKVIVLDVTPDAKTRGDIKEGARANVRYKKDGDKMLAYSIHIVPVPKKRKE